MSIYIVEGLERCGKTTTVNFLRSVIQNPKLIVHHSAKPPSGLTKEESQNWSTVHYTEVLSTFEDLSKKQGFDIIMDRGHLGEYVYGHMYRGNHKDDQYMFYGESFINLKDTYLILLTDNPSNVLSREDGQSLSTSEEKITLERNRFIEAFNRSRIQNKFHFDWTSHFNLSDDFDRKMELYKLTLRDLLGI